MNKLVISLSVTIAIVTVVIISAFSTIKEEVEKIESTHSVKRLGTTNNYQITTLIAGMRDADIALVKYKVPNNCIYDPSEKNTFFSDRDENHIKFFIMEIPNEGNVMVNLEVTVKDLYEELEMPVELEFSSNGEKQTLKLPAVKLREDIGKVEEEEGVVDTNVNTISMVDPKTMITTIVKEVVEEETSSNVKYSIQLLALTTFSNKKLATFCKQHSISMSKVSTETIQGLTKVRYGSFNSEIEAKKMLQQFLDKKIEGAFIITL